MKAFSQLSKILAAAAIIIIFPGPAWSAPSKISFQGTLTNALGQSITTTELLTFKIFDALSGGTELWSETQSVTTNNGVYSVILGSNTPISPSVFSTNNTYLQVEVGGETLTPRKPFSTPGYSFNTDTIDGIDSVDFVQQSEVGNGANQILRLSAGGVLDPSIFQSPKNIVFIKDVKPRGTFGGTCTSGSWNTRDLNTPVGDTTIITLSNNQFTLQPGTYNISAQAPSYMTAQHKAVLYNITDSATSLVGSSEYSNEIQPSVTSSKIDGVISISVPTVFEIQHQCSITRSGVGFGTVAYTPGLDEVYTQVHIQKLN